jgi:Putative auto-transporter adhesin, head GIN domain
MKTLGKVLILTLLVIHSVSAGQYLFRPQPLPIVGPQSLPISSFISLPIPSSAPNVRLTRRLPYADSVFIRGDVNLTIMGGQSPPNVIIKKSSPGLRLAVYNGVIYIRNPKSVNYTRNVKPSLTLYMNSLRRLVVAGDSNIIASNLNTNTGLTIHHCGSGFLHLRNVHLTQLISSGAAIIYINGVHTDRLYILATGHGKVSLTGSTCLLLIRACGCAVVDTQFMSSNSAMVQAEDGSLITVRTYGILRAFASGVSNIYYYVRPRGLLEHTFLSGNVLYLGP